MKIAIVGTSKLTDFEKIRASLKITQLLNYGDILISGGADGIDSLAHKISVELDMKSEIYYPEIHNWLGYRKRNIIIAESCDKLYCITSNMKSEKCYHCNDWHERTGGCWTMKYAKGLGKPTELIIIPVEKKCE